ncbi:MAG: prolyl oligopeptidase family serine peptidase [Polyangiaceae bacterium]|nr:prolyl oligopeptidase family serine peptidase [Polyangiaceae bacterium]
MHNRITARLLTFLVVGSALVVVACGNSDADSSNTDAGPSLGGSSATSSGGAGDTPGGGTASSSGGNADSSGGDGTATSSGASADSSGGGGTATSSGASGGSGGTTSASGGSAGNAGGASGGSAGRGGRGGDAQGGATSSRGGAATGGRATAGTGGSSAAGSGGRSDAAGGSASGGDGGQSGGATGGGDTGGATSGGGLTEPAASQGCGQDPPADGPSTIDVGGSTREYILRLPQGYDAATPNRIIFAFHGASGSADQVDKGDPPRSDLEPTGPYFGIRDVADQQTIFVAGQASGGWSSSDIEYVQVLLDHLKGELCIDTQRIFATGFSMGGMMTITVACSLSDVFRAVAPMSGALQNGCPEGGPIAYWSSHGTSDSTIDMSQGEDARDEFVRRNHCQPDTAPTDPEGCVSYQGCDAGYPVEWCPFDGAHEPPPFSGSAIWAFLSRF